jgi:hypothetical protein
MTDKERLKVRADALEEALQVVESWFAATPNIEGLRGERCLLRSIAAELRDLKEDSKR